MFTQYEGVTSVLVFEVFFIIIIIINLFIVDDKNTIENIFLSAKVTLKTWLI